MEHRLLAISRFFACFPAKMVQNRWLVLLALAIGTLFMLHGALTRTSLDMTIDSFIDQDDPAIEALNEFRTQFGSDDSVFLVYRALDGDVFSQASLRAVQQLTRQLEDWQNLDPAHFAKSVDGVPVDLTHLNHIRRVQSLTTLRVQSVEGDTLRSDRLVPAGTVGTAAELAAIRQRAMAEEDYKLAFYSRDGQYAALLVQTHFGARPLEEFQPAINSAGISLSDSFDAFSPDSFDLAFDESAVIEDVPFQTVDMATYSNFFNALKAVYSTHSASLDFYPVGNPPMMDFVARAMQQMVWLGAGMISVLVLLLWLLFRSLSAVVWPIVTILLSVLWTWGGTAWFGAPLSTMISLTCLLIFAMGIADCVHVMSAYFSRRREGQAHEQALEQAYGKTGLALLVTSLTTMCGVLALSWSDLIPLKVFAVMSAAGVGMAFVFTIVLLPILLSFWHPDGQPVKTAAGRRLLSAWQALSPSRKLMVSAAGLSLPYVLMGAGTGLYVSLVVLLAWAVLRWQEAALRALPDLVARAPWTIMGAFAVVFLGCLYGTSLVRIDSNISELTREGSSLRTAYGVVDQHMAGAQNLEIMIDTGRIDGLLEPEVLQAVDRFQQLIAERYPEQVSRSYSLANVVKDTNQIMNNDDPQFYRIPDSQIMIAQLLYLFNSANPEDRRSLVSDDYSRSHITLNAYNAGSWQYQQFFDELSRDIDTLFAPLYSANPQLHLNVTGTIPLMMRATDEIANSQYSSFLLALAVISVIMILTLGSLQAGLISIVPNLIPPLLAFGLMGLLDIPLDTDTLLIAPVIIGIAVDDTIHFMTHYRLEYASSGSRDQALRSTLNDVGQAVLFTTLVLGLGFAILSFSDYLGMAKIGIFGSLAIFVALLCDLLLLPAMIMVLKPRFGQKRADETFATQGDVA